MKDAEVEDAYSKFGEAENELVNKAADEGDFEGGDDLFLFLEDRMVATAKENEERVCNCKTDAGDLYVARLVGSVNFWECELPRLLQLKCRHFPNCLL